MNQMRFAIKQLGSFPKLGFRTVQVLEKSLGH